MKKIIIPLFTVILGLTMGCKSRVTFVTQTSLGLDVSGTAQVPNKISFSYNRFEGSIVPRKTNGEAHSVYGGLDADMTFFNGSTIKQTFATGKAAMLATEAGADDVNFPGNTSVEKNASLIFLTATTFGLHLTAGEKQMSPNLLLGYRRSEAAVIPVPDRSEEVRSVYADILINTSEATNPITTNFSTLRGVRIKQSFATGRAADSLAAKSSEVKQKLDEAAGIDGTKKSLRQLKAQAGDLVEKIRVELDRLNDNRLPQAVTAFKTAKVFSASDLLSPEQIPPRELCRRMKNALQRLTADEYSTPETVQRLESALAKIKQIRNEN